MHAIQQNVGINIIFIGMAGAGKSTVGRALAQQLGRQFMDTDTVIETNKNKNLQELLSGLGLRGFRELEEQALLSVDVKGHIIATGGSAVYSHLGMTHLKKNGVLVFLDVSLDLLRQRVGDFSSRGLVKAAGQTFEQVYAERKPLYEKHADLTIDCTDQSVTDICETMKIRLADIGYHL